MGLKLSLNYPRLFRTRSTLVLILIGFVIVLVPMIIAFGVVTFYMNKIAEQSEVLVMQAIKATQSGRELVNQLTTMERSALQYMVVREDDLMELYRRTHDDFQNTVSELFTLQLDADQRVTLMKLNRAEHELFEEFGAPLASLEGEKPVAWFERTQQQAQDFLKQSTDWVDREIERLQALAENTNKIVLWLVVAVIPTILLLAGLFSALIVRPLRSIANAIYRLGREDFATPAVVRGPLDVEEVGKRLNWLRLQLAELEEEKTRFLRHMSHELKTPLTGLREGAELLTEGVVGTLNKEQRQIVQIMQENILLFQGLIENLVNFNQALSRNLEMNMATTSLKDLIQRAVAAQQLAWTAKNLHINLDLAALHIQVDKAKFSTIVDNLLSNAIKFSPEGSDIFIDLTGSDEGIQLDVRDSGPGFHPEDRKLVFQAFYQGRIMPYSHVKGSGLGLAIAREYTEAHGGSIEVIGTEQGGHIRVIVPNYKKDIAA